MSVWARGLPDLSADSMPKLRSIDIGCIPAFVRSIHRSPVPLAKSSTVLPSGRSKSRTARFRQRTSSRNEMMRFRRSYFGAIASNMSRTAATFFSPSGSRSVSQDRSSLTQLRLGPGLAGCSTRLLVWVCGDIASRSLIELFDLSAGRSQGLQLNVGLGRSPFEQVFGLADRRARH